MSIFRQSSLDELNFSLNDNNIYELEDNISSKCSLNISNSITNTIKFGTVSIEDDIRLNREYQNLNNERKLSLKHHIASDEIVNDIVKKIFNNSLKAMKDLSSTLRKEKQLENFKNILQNRNSTFFNNKLLETESQSDLSFDDRKSQNLIERMSENNDSSINHIIRETNNMKKIQFKIENKNQDNENKLTNENITDINENALILKQSPLKNNTDKAEIILVDENDQNIEENPEIILNENARVEIVLKNNTDNIEIKEEGISVHDAPNQDILIDKGTISGTFENIVQQDIIIKEDPISKKISSEGENLIIKNNPKESDPESIEPNAKRENFEEEMMEINNNKIDNYNDDKDENGNETNLQRESSFHNGNTDLNKVTANPKPDLESKSDEIKFKHDMSNENNLIPEVIIEEKSNENNLNTEVIIEDKSNENNVNTEVIIEEPNENNLIPEMKIEEKSNENNLNTEVIIEDKSNENNLNSEVIIEEQNENNINTELEKEEKSKNNVNTELEKEEKSKNNVNTELEKEEKNENNVNTELEKEEKSIVYNANTEVEKNEKNPLPYDEGEKKADVPNLNEEEIVQKPLLDEIDKPIKYQENENESIKMVTHGIKFEINADLENKSNNIQIQKLGEIQDNKMNEKELKSDINQLIQTEEQNKTNIIQEINDEIKENLVVPNKDLIDNNSQKDKNIDIYHEDKKIGFPDLNKLQENNLKEGETNEILNLNNHNNLKIPIDIISPLAPNEINTLIEENLLNNDDDKKITLIEMKTDENIDRVIINQKEDLPQEEFLVNGDAFVDEESVNKNGNIIKNIEKETKIDEKNIISTNNKNDENEIQNNIFENIIKPEDNNIFSDKIQGEDILPNELVLSKNILDKKMESEMIINKPEPEILVNKDEIINLNNNEINNIPVGLKDDDKILSEQKISNELLKNNEKEEFAKETNAQIINRDDIIVSKRLNTQICNIGETSKIGHESINQINESSIKYDRENENTNEIEIKIEENTKFEQTRKKDEIGPQIEIGPELPNVSEHPKLIKEKNLLEEQENINKGNNIDSDNALHQELRNEKTIIVENPLKEPNIEKNDLILIPNYTDEKPENKETEQNNHFDKLIEEAEEISQQNFKNQIEEPEIHLENKVEDINFQEAHNNSVENKNEKHKVNDENFEGLNPELNNQKNNPETYEESRNNLMRNSNFSEEKNVHITDTILNTEKINENWEETHNRKQNIPNLKLNAQSESVNNTFISFKPAKSQDHSAGEIEIKNQEQELLNNQPELQNNTIQIKVEVSLNPENPLLIKKNDVINNIESKEDNTILDHLENPMNVENQLAIKEELILPQDQNNTDRNISINQDSNIQKIKNEIENLMNEDKQIYEDEVVIKKILNENENPLEQKNERTENNNIFIKNEKNLDDYLNFLNSSEYAGGVIGKSQEKKTSNMQPNIKEEKVLDLAIDQTKLRQTVEIKDSFNREKEEKSEINFQNDNSIENKELTEQKIIGNPKNEVDQENNKEDSKFIILNEQPQQLNQDDNKILESKFLTLNDQAEKLNEENVQNDENEINCFDDPKKLLDNKSIKQDPPNKIEEQIGNNFPPIMQENDIVDNKLQLIGKLEISNQNCNSNEFNQKSPEKLIQDKEIITNPENTNNDNIFKLNQKETINNVFAGKDQVLEDDDLKIVENEGVEEKEGNSSSIKITNAQTLEKNCEEILIEKIEPEISKNKQPEIEDKSRRDYIPSHILENEKINGLRDNNEEDFIKLKNDKNQIENNNLSNRSIKDGKNLHEQEKLELMKEELSKENSKELNHKLNEKIIKFFSNSEDENQPSQSQEHDDQRKFSEINQKDIIENGNFDIPKDTDAKIKEIFQRNSQAKLSKIENKFKTADDVNKDYDEINKILEEFKEKDLNNQTPNFLQKANNDVNVIDLVEQPTNQNERNLNSATKDKKRNSKINLVALNDSRKNKVSQTEKEKNFSLLELIKNPSHENIKPLNKIEISDKKIKNDQRKLIENLNETLKLKPEIKDKNLNAEAKFNSPNSKKINLSSIKSKEMLRNIPINKNQEVLKSQDNFNKFKIENIQGSRKMTKEVEKENAGSKKLIQSPLSIRKEEKKFYKEPINTEELKKNLVLDEELNQFDIGTFVENFDKNSLKNPIKYSKTTSTETSNQVKHPVKVEKIIINDQKIKNDSISKIFNTNKNTKLKFITQEKAKKDKLYVDSKSNEKQEIHGFQNNYIKNDIKVLNFVNGISNDHWGQSFLNKLNSEVIDDNLIQSLKLANKAKNSMNNDIIVVSNNNIIISNHNPQRNIQSVKQLNSNIENTLKSTTNTKKQSNEIQFPFILECLKKA